MLLRPSIAAGALLLFLFAVPEEVPAQSLGTAFTYQGQLLSKGQPVDGDCDLRFSLYEDETGGLPIEDPVSENAIAIRDGHFTTLLDFGDVFTGFALWLEVAVRCPPGIGGYTTLNPRQRITAVPYAFSGKMTLKTLTLGPRSFRLPEGGPVNLNGGWLTPRSQNSVTWMTELQLPNDARVRRIRCRWFDEPLPPEDDRNAGIMRFELRRLKVEDWPLSSFDGDIMAEAEVDTTGFRGTKSTALGTDNITHEIIDVERYVYLLSFSFSLHPGNDSEEFVHFGGCHVDYLTAVIP
jgi:hypothetical protein